MKKNFFRVNTDPNELQNALSRALESDFGIGCCNFANLVIVVPNPLVYSTVIDLFRKLNNGSATILPKLTTFTDWVAETNKTTEVYSRASAEIFVQQLISRLSWVSQTDSFSLAHQLVNLSFELESLDVNIPGGRSFEDYESIEIRLIKEVYLALSGSANDKCSPGTAFRSGLNELLSDTHKLVYLIGNRISDVEQDFIDRYSETQKVRHFYLSSNYAIGAEAEFYKTAFPLENDGVNIFARARAIKDRVSSSPVLHKISIFGARNLEEEAHSIALKVRQWIASGRKSIAIIVLDRKVARRLRALLEREKILVSDQSGWKMSTAHIASLLLNLLALVESKFNIKELINYVTHFEGKNLLTRVEYSILSRALYKVWRTDRDACGIANILGLLNSKGWEFLEPLSALETTLGDGQKKTHREWILRFLGSFDSIGIRSILESDLAGYQIIKRLEEISVEVESSGVEVGLSEWSGWLRHVLETSTFKDEQIKSSIIFSDLEKVQQCNFEGIIFAGANEDKFPNVGETTRLLSESLRNKLGLPSYQDRFAEIREMLFSVLLSSQTIFVTWRDATSENGDGLSSPFRCLDLCHEIIWGSGLTDNFMTSAIQSMQPSAFPALISKNLSDAEVTLNSKLLPTRISVSGYQALIDCPYKYFAQNILKLKPDEFAFDEIEKRDFGSVVHVVLDHMHRDLKVFKDVDNSTLQKRFEILFDDTLKAKFGEDKWTLGWKAKFKIIATEYIRWQKSREEEGWLYAFGESNYERLVGISQDRNIVFEGRLDRVDAKSIGDETIFSILDYKTTRAEVLRKAAVNVDEDIQLLAYSGLLGKEKSSASYVVLDSDGVQEISLVDPDLEDSSILIQRLRNVFALVVEGKELPANGIRSECQRCDYRGICRKGGSWI